MTAITETKIKAKETVREVKPWVNWLARAGYTAKGVIYIIIGCIAFQTAFGKEQIVGSKGALVEIITQPYGQVLMWIVAIGLLGYVAWRVTQAIVDPDNQGTGAKGIAARGFYFISGLIHLSLAIYAINLTLGAGGGGGSASSGQGTEGWTAKLMAEPYGRWLVGIIGLAVIAAGIYQIYQAYSEKFKNEFKLFDMSETERKATIIGGKVGLTARAIVFAMIGWFFLQAAFTFNAQEAGGLTQALQEILSQPYGVWLLALMAIGLVCYGGFSIMKAIYRYINVQQ